MDPFQSRAASDGSKRSLPSGSAMRRLDSRRLGVRRAHMWGEDCDRRYRTDRVGTVPERGQRTLLAPADRAGTMENISRLDRYLRTDGVSIADRSTDTRLDHR